MIEEKDVNQPQEIAEEQLDQINGGLQATPEPPCIPPLPSPLKPKPPIKF